MDMFYIYLNFINVSRYKYKTVNMFEVFVPLKTHTVSSTDSTTELTTKQTKTKNNNKTKTKQNKKKCCERSGYLDKVRGVMAHNLSYYNQILEILSPVIYS